MSTITDRDYAFEGPKPKMLHIDADVTQWPQVSPNVELTLELKHDKVAIEEQDILQFLDALSAAQQRPDITCLSFTLAEFLEDRLSAALDSLMQLQDRQWVVDIFYKYSRSTFPNSLEVAIPLFLSLRYIRELRMEAVWSRWTDLPVILEVVSQFQGLHHFYIEGFRVDVSVLVRLFRQASTSTISRLSLVRCHFASFEEIGNLLTCAPRLQALDVTECDPRKARDILGRDPNFRLTPLFDAIASNQSLKRLSLVWGGLGDEDFERLAASIPTSALEHVNLCHNKFGPDGANTVVVMLQELPNLLSAPVASKNVPSDVIDRVDTISLLKSFDNHMQQHSVNRAGLWPRTLHRLGNLRERPEVGINLTYHFLRDRLDEVAARAHFRPKTTDR
eukprot:Nitzschia sp. Nitz4//scaffold355_size15944//14469//15641//NITZ4_008869-RA/size15944-processed-gene-0.18-mRNA-1//1//CDS//3329548954//2209//frame0